MGEIDRIILAQFQDVALWVLAFVFLISGIIKVRHPLETAVAISNFRVSAGPRRPLALILGTGEIALGAGLLVDESAQLALPVAVVVLWFFTYLVGRAYLAGNRFDCFCFGQSREPLSAWTWLRTVLLAGIGTAALLAQPEDSASRFSTTGAYQAAIAAALLGSAALLLSLRTLLRRGPTGDSAGPEMA